MNAIQHKAKVYIQGRQFRAITANTFKIAGKYDIVEKLEDSDIVVWTGGDDIWPGLYGEKPIQGTYFDKARDKDDVLAVERAYKKNKFMVGICRGAQLLNVIPNGGTLWQNVDNHGSTVHRAFDCLSGTWMHVNSVHHQMCKVTDDAQILCWAQESKRKESDGVLWTMPVERKDLDPVPEKDKDVEAAFYPKTRSLLAQFHPEFGCKETNTYFFKSLMDKFYWRE